MSLVWLFPFKTTYPVIWGAPPPFVFFGSFLWNLYWKKHFGFLTHLTTTSQRTQEKALNLSSALSHSAKRLCDRDFLFLVDGTKSSLMNQKGYGELLVH